MALPRVIVVEPRTMKALLLPGRCALLALALLIAGASKAQTVTNGSATGTVGNSMLQYLPGWAECDQPPNNSPDVCDMTMPSWIGLVTVPAAPSPDGGSWIGLANGVNPIE